MKMHFLLFILVLMPIAHCSLNSWDIEVYLQEDGRSDWVVYLGYDENVTRSDYYVLTELEEVKVYVDEKPIECSVSESGFGTSILCEDIYAREIEYRFKAKKLISISDSLRVFRYRFPITQPTNNFSVTVKLPLGSFLVDPSRLEGSGLLPYEPGFGEQGSDGRRILVKWVLKEPKVGDSLNASVIYEQVIAGQVLIAAGVGIIFLIFALLLFFARRRGIRHILPVLTDGERKVMEILLKDKEVDQRRIVKECDFSKSKVSRIIHDLEKRGLITRVPKGRNNIIALKKGKPEEK